MQEKWDVKMLVCGFVDVNFTGVYHEGSTRVFARGFTDQVVPGFSRTTNQVRGVRLQPDYR